MAGVLMIQTWVIVPSEGRECLHECLRSLRGQVDRVLVVANQEYDGSDLQGVDVVVDPSPERNISRWWNLGLSIASMSANGQWNAVVINDDVIMNQGSVDRLITALRESPALLAFPGPRDAILSELSGDRITGWCFALRGESGLRADEKFAWWYGDNDLDWRARASGGCRMVSGVDVQHTDPNGYTNRVPSLAEQAGRDREMFFITWGRLPH